MRYALIAAALIAAACQPEPTKPVEPTAAALPAMLPNGSTLSYTRSNSDGSMPERIYVHIVSPTEVHVTKMVAPCTDAAYVTARFDPATSEATQLVGGRLQKDGTQLPQAWLTLRPDRTLAVRLGDPNSEPAEIHSAPTAPWRMYDFDLAEFALFGPREPKDFKFGLALAWPDGSSPLVRTLGDAQAAFKAIETNGNRPANRFTVTGPAFGNQAGEMLFDAQYGHVIEAHFARPNHTDYTDFLLKLEASTITGGDAAWSDAINAHWQGCS